MRRPENRSRRSSPVVGQTSTAFFFWVCTQKWSFKFMVFWISAACFSRTLRRLLFVSGTVLWCSLFLSAIVSSCLDYYIFNILILFARGKCVFLSLVFFLNGWRTSHMIEMRCDDKPGVGTGWSGLIVLIVDCTLKSKTGLDIFVTDSFDLKL